MNRKLLWRGLILCIFLCGLVSVAAAEDDHIRKPTDHVDDGQGQGDTTNPEAAYDFPESYDESTWAETLEPDHDPSITWHTWNMTGVVPYEALSLTVTINASGFLTDEWNFYYVTDPATEECNSDANFLVGTDGELLGSNPETTNVTTPLPRDQDLSALQVCLTGNSQGGGDDGVVRTFDIRTNGTPDETPPEWRNQQQNVSTIVQGEPVKLAAQGFDAVNLSHATLATNETGTWENRTAHGSPRTLYTAEEWTWSNFTWNNGSVTAGSTVGWRIWFNDTAGNYNRTGTAAFSLEPPMLHVSLEDPQGPFTTAQNETFPLNASVLCLYGDCGEVMGEARYNGSDTEPDTRIEESGDPFHTTERSNPLTCDTDLQRDEGCHVEWDINATGEIGSTWLLDVELSSDLSTVASNDTESVEVEIMQTVIDIDVTWDVIDFGSVFPGTDDNRADGNEEEEYRVVVEDSTTVDVDIWMNASDLYHTERDDRIGAGNMTWNATENDPTVTQNLSHTLQPVRRGVAAGSVLTLFYWLNMPTGIFAGDYTGTLWVTANETTT